MFEKLGNGRVKSAQFSLPQWQATDLPYRLLARECGADFTITEFTNSTALSRKLISWAKMESHPDEEPFIHKSLEEMIWLLPYYYQKVQI